MTGRVILHFMKAENAATAIAQPAALIASAAMPRPMLDPSPHPRGAGTRARVLADDVRECGVLDLLTAYRGHDPAELQVVEGDHVHPNVTGHRIAAEAIDRFLRSQLWTRAAG